MINRTIAIALISTFFTACGGGSSNTSVDKVDPKNGGDDIIEGSGNLLTEERDLMPFDHLVIEVGNVKVKSCSHQVRITADDNILPVIELDNTDGVLTVSTDKNFTGRSTIDIEVCMQSLTMLDSSTIGSVDVDLFVSDIVVHSAGIGELTINNIQGTDAEFISSGAGSINLTGTIDSYSLEHTGIGSIDASELVAGDVFIDLDTIGDTAINANFVSGELTGIGNLLVNQGARIEVNTTGIGRVIETNE